MITKPTFKPYEGNDPYIFVSYSHKDSAQVFPILQKLHERGLRVWYDEGIDPGSEWPEEIANHLLNCGLFLLFMSPDAAESHNVRREITMAVDRKKPLMNVFIEETELKPGLQLQLNLIQHVSYAQGKEDFEEFIDRLTGTLLKKAPDIKEQEIAEAPQLLPPPEVNQSPAAQPLTKRGYLFLEDSDWKQANEYFNRALDTDPEYAPAYIGKLCADLKIRFETELTNHTDLLDDNPDYKKALRFADADYRDKVIGYNDAIKERIEEEQERITEERERIEEEQQRIEEERKRQQYDKLVELKNYASSKTVYQGLAKEFRAMDGYRDSNEFARECEELIKQLDEKEPPETEQARMERKWRLEQSKKEAERLAEEKREQERIEAERRDRERQERKAKTIKYTVIEIIAVVTAITMFFVLISAIGRHSAYNSAISLLNEKKYKQAIIAFRDISDYKDSSEKIEEAKRQWYSEAVALFDNGQYEEALKIFEFLGDYDDSAYYRELIKPLLQ